MSILDIKETTADELLQSSNFIDRFAGTILRDVPNCNPEWAEACAIAVLSTGVGSNKFTRTGIGRLHLNVWHFFISPSGTSKTVPLDYFVEPTLEQAGRILSGVPDDVDEEDGDEEKESKNTDLLLPSTFSVEAILKHMRKKNQREGLIKVDEVTGFFKQIQSKPYMTDIYETYSVMYDCQTLRVTFVKLGTYRPIKNPYVVVLMAGVPLVYKFLPVDYSLQGTANRMLHIIGDEVPLDENASDVDREFPADIKMAEEERNTTLTDYAEWIAKLRRSSLKFVDLNSEGRDLVMNKNKINKASNATSDSYLKGYLHRSYEMTVKLAALHCLGAKGIADSNLEMAIPSHEDIEWAIKKVDRHIEYYKRMLKEWGHGVMVHEAAPVSIEQEVSMIERAFGDRTEISRDELLRKTRFSSKRLDEIIQSMPEIQTTWAESTGGRRPIIYKKRIDNA